MKKLMIVSMFMIAFFAFILFAEPEQITFDTVSNPVLLERFLRNPRWPGDMVFDGVCYFNGSYPIIFEGATIGGGKTYISVTEPTTNCMITLPKTTGTVLLNTSAVRTAQQYVQGIAGAKVGASGEGWVINAADSKCLATLPASQTAENMVIPITVPLKVGYTITGFSIIGQIESAGGTVTLDADLRKHTAATTNVADASVGTITQLSVTEDTQILSGKSGLNEAVANNETFYVVITGTTAASTDIAIQGITLTVNEL